MLELLFLSYAQILVATPESQKRGGERRSGTEAEVLPHPWPNSKLEILIIIHSDALYELPEPIKDNKKFNERNFVGDSEPSA